ncbi:MAG TPA: NADH-quinone oxidoreductase subunit H, partial [bacterium]|nr:NADH-quinone oxidoreductase subunit H [bacterium]
SPLVGVACVVCAVMLIPTLGNRALFAFQGDIIFMAYLLGLMRFFLVVAALDTGSSFEGMGASREVTFSAIAEPALLLGMAVLAKLSGTMSLSGMFAGLNSAAWLAAGPALAVTVASFLIILLSENARIPVDDPNTHLELTMIHEVMVLDYGGPDLGVILYTASLKLWIFSALIVNTVLSCLEMKGLTAVGAFAGGMILVAILVGVIESVMARLRLLTVPRLLSSAVVFSILAFILVLRLSGR